MKIAIVIEHFNPARGGAETYTADLVSWLASHRHDVTVFTQDWAAEPTGVTMVTVPVKGISAARRYLSFSTEASQLVSEGAFEVVHSMARILRQNIFHPHGGVMKASLEKSLDSSSSGIERGFRRAARWLNTKQDILLELENIIYTEEPPPRFVAVSDMVARDMVRYYGVGEDRIEVIHNGVDTARFTPENRDGLGREMRGTLGIGQEETVLLLVAHNYRLKGAQIFIRVLSELKKRAHKGLKGVIAGSEHGAQGVYPRLAAKMGLADDIIFHGSVADIERFYAAADIYLHPTYYDPMSLVVLEALSSGLPVVTTRRNGCSEIITEGVEGFAVEEPGDIAGLTAAVELLLDEPRRRESALAARALAEKYPLERNFQAIGELYKKAAAEPMPPLNITRGD